MAYRVLRPVPSLVSATEAVGNATYCAHISAICSQYFSVVKSNKCAYTIQMYISYMGGIYRYESSWEICQ